MDSKTAQTEDSPKRACLQTMKYRLQNVPHQSELKLNICDGSGNNVVPLICLKMPLRSIRAPLAC